MRNSIKLATRTWFLLSIWTVSHWFSCPGSLDPGSKPEWPLNQAQHLARPQQSSIWPLCMPITQFKTYRFSVPPSPLVTFFRKIFGTKTKKWTSLPWSKCHQSQKSAHLECQQKTPSTASSRTSAENAFHTGTPTTPFLDIWSFGSRIHTGSIKALYLEKLPDYEHLIKN